MDNIVVSIIIKGEVNTDIWKVLQSWKDVQGVSVELVVDQLNPNVQFTGGCWLPQLAHESKKEYLYRASVASKGQYISWIDSDDEFCEGALKKMCDVFSANHNAKVVCGQFAVCDLWGEKVFLKDPPIGESRVIQRVESCFLVEKGFLLSALTECECETLWAQYIWNFVYQQGGEIVYIDEVLLKKNTYEVHSELKKSFVQLIKEFADSGNVGDLNFILESIEKKCGKEYLLNRLIGCISGEAQSYWEKRHLADDKKKDSPKENKVIFAPFVAKRELVIYVEYGGLGDNLFLSHIPRIAKESGKYDRVYLARRTLFRSQDIYKMIWKLNPFLDGVTEENGCPVVLPKEAWESIQNKEGNILDYTMIALGLDDGKRFHEPEIYYKPQQHNILQSKVIYDPNYITNAGDSVTPEMVHRFFCEHGVIVDYMLMPKGKYISIHSLKEQYKTKSLFDFCDALYSAKDVYCYATGTATLCAAIGKSARVLYGENMKGWGEVFFHSKLHEYKELTT